MAKEKVMVSEQYLQDIANSIRTKLETEDKYKPSEFSSKIDEMNIATPVTKGIIINEFNSNGYATDVTVVGMTTLPDSYLNSNSSNSLTKNLLNVNLPDNLTSIGNNAFAKCSNLNTIDIPDTVTSIGSYAFNYCSNLSLTKLPDSLTNLGPNAFYSCSKVNITEIPAGVDVLNPVVFYNCTSIRSATWLGPIRIVSPDTYMGCKWLSELILPNVTAVPTLTGFPLFQQSYIASGSGKIYVPDNLVEDFKTATNWSNYAAQIKPISELEVSE